MTRLPCAGLIHNTSPMRPPSDTVSAFFACLRAKRWEDAARLVGEKFLWRTHLAWILTTVLVAGCGKPPVTPAAPAPEGTCRTNVAQLDGVEIVADASVGADFMPPSSFHGGAVLTARNRHLWPSDLVADSGWYIVDSASAGLPLMGLEVLGQTAEPPLLPSQLMRVTIAWPETMADQAVLESLRSHDYADYRLQVRSRITGHAVYLDAHHCEVHRAI